MLSREERRLLLQQARNQPDWNFRLVLQCATGLIFLLMAPLVGMLVDSQDRPQQYQPTLQQHSEVASQAAVDPEIVQEPEQATLSQSVRSKDGE